MLTFYLTFFLASILAFSLACVRVQAPTASRAVAPWLKSRDPHLAGGDQSISLTGASEPAAMVQDNQCDRYRWYRTLKFHIHIPQFHCNQC